MNKSIQMRYYHALRKTNPALSKSKAGRSMIMKEAVWMSGYGLSLFKSKSAYIQIIGGSNN